jgi:hypothetical protein
LKTNHEKSHEEDVLSGRRLKVPMTYLSIGHPSSSRYWKVVIVLIVSLMMWSMHLGLVDRCSEVGDVQG